MFRKSLIIATILLAILIAAWIIFTVVLQNVNNTDNSTYYSCDQRERGSVPFEVDYEYVEKNITGETFYLKARTGMDALFFSVYSLDGELVESADHYLRISDLETRLVNCSTITEEQFKLILQ